VLAKSILSRGAYRSIVGETLGDLYDVEPQLSRAALLQRRPDTDVEGAARHALIERVSIIGTTPAGWRLLSDVTTSLDEHYRPAALNRLMAELVRAARTLGDDMVFESSGERTWARVRQGIESLLLRLLHDGALRGATPAEAFTVRCDRTTMSQNDIDNGRMVVNVSISPAAPIEQITVVLALSAGGQVALIR
jgi:phage tail sheath protein FI